MEPIKIEHPNYVDIDVTIGTDLSVTIQRGGGYPITMSTKQALALAHAIIDKCEECRPVDLS